MSTTQHTLPTAAPAAVKPRITRDGEEPSRPWHVVCPCGFEWHSAHHRLALFLATNHTHRDQEGTK